MKVLITWHVDIITAFCIFMEGENKHFDEPSESTRKLQGLKSLALADVSREPPSVYLADMQLLTGPLEFEQPK